MSADATARSLGLASCHECKLLVRLQAGDGEVACPRCGSRLHARKQASLQRCWALLFAAAVLYVPANVFPIMTTTYLGVAQTDTIMSGVIYLAQDDWPLALVVFAASVMVPLVKLVALAFLLWSVRSRSHWRPADRTRLYRITEAVGRWSMVDIYVVTILVALVRLDVLANVDAELGAVFFGAVVVITIFAAQAFDPRLIWDAARPSPQRPSEPLPEPHPGPQLGAQGSPA
jgi:paraquat-inducible protein A